MLNRYYKPDEPRQIFRTPKTRELYVSGTGRCSHCPSWLCYCEVCKQELSPFKTLEDVQQYERAVQVRLLAST